MAETRPPAMEVLVVAGTERVRVTGRAALIIAQVVQYAEQINDIPVGRLVTDFAHAKVQTDLTQSFPAVRLTLDGSARSIGLMGH